MSSAASDFSKLLQKSKEILIVIPPSPSDDILGSAFALFHLLEKQQKNLSLLVAEPLGERLSFLKIPEKIISSLNGSRDFVLIFNTEKNKIIRSRIEEKPEEYIIRITPEHGSIDPRDFSFMPARFKYDLVIVLGVESLEWLGLLYQENTDLFFEVPKINIDNHSANEGFGQINLVDITASSVAEILAKFALEHMEKMIDKEIAQALLTGIISATESFQKPNTTPNAMILAAQLMKYKADQPKIIRHLYKTKSLSFLKLWGRVMARLNWHEKHRAVWSLISIEDFVQSRAGEKDIPDVLQQLHENFAEGQLFAVFYNETANTTVARLRFDNENIARQISDLFNIAYHPRQLTISFESKNLLESEKEFLEKLETL